MSRCDVISDVINIKSTFWRLISNGLSISDVKMNLSKIFRNFQNGRHFEARANFETGNFTGSWVLHRDRPCYCLRFDILFDALAPILTELWLFQSLTYFLISWPSYVTFDLETLLGFVLRQTTYIDQVWWWLVKNCDLYRWNVTISFKHEYRRHTLTSRYDVIGDVIIMKIILVDDLHTIFLYLLSNWGYIENCEIFKNFQNWRKFEVGRTFSS